MEVFDGRALPITHCNGNKEAILCIHEFAATPYSFSYTAQKLAEVGYDLFVPLLPGCGTSPKEFISTRFSDWYNYIKEFYLDLCAKYKAITLVGASLGGAMALTLAAEFGKELHSSTPSTLGGYPPKRVVTIGAVTYIFSPLKNSWMRPDSLLVRPASWFISSIGAGIVLPAPTADLGKDGKNQWMGYKGLYLKQIASILSATRKLRKNLRYIEAPLTIIHSPKDKIVPYGNMKYIAKKVSSQDVVTKTYPMEGRNHDCHLLMITHSSRDQVISDILEPRSI